MSQTAAAVSTPQKGQRLDDVMLAMDVVDTLRHRSAMVARELDAEGREEDLIARLREIYTAQGIEVPDHILREGVKALEEQRFTYSPPKGGLSVALAKLYVRRDRWLKPVLTSVAVLLAAILVYQFAIAGPAERRAEAVRVELTETLPAALADLRDQAQALSTEERGDVLAQTYYQDGTAAAARGDQKAAQAVRDQLQTLIDDLGAAYQVRIVSRPGEMSGVFRIPDDVPGARNYYLIVEAIDPAGRPVPVTLTSEEDQKTRRVSKWGQRVTEQTFNRVAADKKDDQIIQNALIGTKSAGQLEPAYEVETPGGVILEW
ncbi:DUF6384 family protein [Parvularcula sp. LCG005]|uniref:DUF6384 family protein n=1 Tax=Parvularcula sp. LCG005 TaxID=3078805 RepID=UPI0029436319|nr:DUF6384 family protein [Parvularcula sp. LCG005]WOI54427.1 DUF6384 family protein [Parvularcula sp. LCG005]